MSFQEILKTQKTKKRPLSLSASQPLSLSASQPSQPLSLSAGSAGSAGSASQPDQPLSLSAGSAGSAGSASQQQTVKSSPLSIAWYRLCTTRPPRSIVA